MQHVFLPTGSQVFISYKRDENAQQQRANEALSQIQALIAEGLSAKDIVPKTTVCSDTHVDISKIL